MRKTRQSFVVEFEKNMSKSRLELKLENNANTRLLQFLGENETTLTYSILTVFTEEELQKWLSSSKYFKNAVIIRRIKMKTIKIWFSGASTQDHFFANYGKDHRCNIYLYKKNFTNNRFHRNDYEICYKLTNKKFHKYFEYDKSKHRWQLKEEYMRAWLYQIADSYEIFNLNTLYNI